MSQESSPAARARLLDACGVVARDDLVRIRVTGADHVDYLHRMLTQDLSKLAVGQATYACLLTVKGRILGDMQVVREDDALVLEVPRAAQEAVRTPLERYVIADDVHFEVLPDAPRLSLWGPTAAEALAAAGSRPPDDRRARTAGGVSICRFDRRGLPCFEIVGPLELPDVPLVGIDAMDAARVHHLIPAFGSELSDEVLFNEAGLEEAVSWTKGCYPGQEPVVMAKHRGRPPRRLVRIEGAAAAGMALSLEGDVVGQVTTATEAVGDRPPAALAYVRTVHVEPGVAVDLGSGGVGVIRAVSGQAPAEQERS